MVRIFIAETESKITSEIFIKRIANNQLGIAKEKLIIDKNKYGKPFLVNFPNVHYNVSHTKGLIVCAVSDNCVGIDVERIKPFNKRIVERFFSENEREYIFASKENQDERFAVIWTKKESYIKWLGKGMAIPIDSFDVLSFRKTPKFFNNEYQRYYISLCTERTEYVKLYNSYSEKEILTDFKM